MEWLQRSEARRGKMSLLIARAAFATGDGYLQVMRMLEGMANGRPAAGNESETPTSAEEFERMLKG